MNRDEATEAVRKAVLNVADKFSKSIKSLFKRVKAVIDSQAADLYRQNAELSKVSSKTNETPPPSPRRPGM